MIFSVNGALPVLSSEPVTNAPQIMEEMVQPEPVGAQPTSQKKSLWKKFNFDKLKITKKTKNLQNTQNAGTPASEQSSSDVFSASGQQEDKKPVEIKSISQIQEEQAHKKRSERRADKRAEANMTVKERQEALADRVSSDILDESITASTTTIKGGVEENVIVSIDDCVKLALYNNPTIRYAISNSDIYKSKIAQAWANYFPQFSVGTAYSKNKMLATNFKFPRMKYDLWNAAAIEGSLLLYDFGKTRQVANIAKKAHEASISDIQTAINDTVYNVKAAYFQYLYTLRQQQVLQSTVDKFNKHYLEAKAAYEVGVKAKIDVVTAEYNLSNAKLDLIKAKNQVEAAKAQLNNTMGLPSYSNYNVTDKMEISEYNLDFDKLIEQAYELRPELQSVIKKAEASKIAITSSKLAFTPDLRGFGSYTLGGKEYADNYGYQLGVRLSYPTSNFFLLKKQVDEARATYERDQADLEKKQNDVYLDVKTAYIDYVNARDSVPVAHQAMNEAKLQYEIAAGRYKTGLNTAIELKDAEITYRNAQLNYYNALMQYNTSVASVEKTVGAPIKPSGSDGEINAPVDINL